MSFRHALTATLLVATSVGATAPAAGQQRDDVVLLGEIHGTRPPDAYFAFKARNPDAFSFQRAWKARNPRLRRLSPESDGDATPFEVVRRSSGPVGVEGGVEGGPLAALGPREGPVEGTIRVPVVLGRFADSGPAPYSRDAVQQQFFDGPNSRYGTITELYDEMSGGRVELLGTTADWVQSDLTRTQVAAGVSGLGGSRVGEFILDLLSRNRHLDWGQFDNDGPDGVPNSGDDDGYVDVLAVMHPTRGAECEPDPVVQPNVIWSHKWSLKSATGQVFHTDTPATGHGRPIAVDDYTIQPVLSCDASSINEIGVLAHELGHGFGLPDLYDTRGGGARHNGAGRWDLMASGSWGCSPIGGPHRPCHMGAWSKAQLGWVDVIDLAPAADHGVLTLDPVQDGGVVWRVAVPDSDEYFLLENRQRIGFDQDLHQTGLLVWQVDEDRVLQRWSSNTVNSGSGPMGVHLRQADGRNDLGSTSGNRSDTGDPFPGSTHNTAFHAASVPAASSWDGHPSGLTVLDIGESGGRVSAHVLTRFQNVTIRLENGSGDIRVDGAPVPGLPVVLRSAPFQEHVVEVTPGTPVADGVRLAFDRWADSADEGPSRLITTGIEDQELVAIYGNEREVRVRPTLTGQVSDVPAGALAFAPTAQEESDGYWFPDGEMVIVEAVSEPGYAFEGWAGALEGQANPASFEVREPVDFEAAFRLTYDVPDEVALSVEAARQVEFTLTAENAVEPVTWTRMEGTLPPGISLSSEGEVRGAALGTGSYAAVIHAQDRRGLTASTTMRMEVGPPHLGADVLTGPFLLTGAEPDNVERVFLDRLGNENGRYDLGDLRAFLLAWPDLPLTVADQELLRVLVPAVRFGEEGGGR